MRRHRLLFVLPSLAALGLFAFAIFANDRYAVSDVEASQLVGGLCSSTFDSINCTNSCVGNGICDTGTTSGDDDSTKMYLCGGGGVDCHWFYAKRNPNG